MNWDDPYAGVIDAVEWVLNDASFKAPEQIGPVAERWIDRLESALKAARKVNTSR
jgi:hypothetical protein